MSDLNKRLVFVVAGLLLISACSTSGGGEVVQETTTTEAVAATIAPATIETATTLSDREIAQDALEAAEAEIEAAIQFWYTFPIDTALGDAGMPLDVLVDPMRQRLIDLTMARTTAGEIQRSRGGDRIDVLNVRVDMETGIADVDICSMGDHVLVDVETGEEITADSDSAWEGQVQAALVDGVWKLEDFFSDQENGGNQCAFSD